MAGETRTTTTVTSTTTSLHTISWTGPSGISFALILVALFFYILGFSTKSWYVYPFDAANEGLWETCTCYPDAHVYSWFKATQAMITIGLVGLIVCLILGVLYMLVHSPSVSKNAVIKGLVVTAFITVLFALIGLIIYGAKRGSPHWSYAMVVIGTIATLAAGIVAIVQMRNSNVPCL